MLIAVLLIIVICIVAGGFGLVLHGLIWLFWVALVVLLLALAFGVTRRVFSRNP